MGDAHTYDVIILGSGLSGSTLGAILAKNAFRVLLLEKGTFPRFAVGEAMLPQCNMWIWIIAQRFGIPELLNLCKIQDLSAHVSPMHGIKRSIAFTYHRPGTPLDSRQMHQFIGPEMPMLNETHLYRQDVDQYLLRTAIAYGAISREGVDVVDVETSPSGVRVELKSGEVFTSRYLVDGSGYRSIVASKYGLREEPTPAITQSRTLFTHINGLRPFDDLLDPGDYPRQSFRWHDGTLHHVFDGGWFWIIPFDNNRYSKNSLCSIGLSLDLRKFPQRGLPPEQEFREIVDRFPTIASHLKGTTPVRPWTATGRLQYSSKAAAGQRFVLLSHAYGFIDALYSRGMINTFESLNVLSSELIHALNSDDFSRLSRMDDFYRAEFDETDLTVSNAYRAMADFDLWNAWVKMWIANKISGDLWIFRAIMKFLSSGNPAELASFDQASPHPGSAAPYAEHMQSNLKQISTMLDRFERRELTGKAVAGQIYDLLSKSDWLPPLLPWTDPSARYLDFTPELMTKILTWAKTQSPQRYQEQLFDFLPPMSPGVPMSAHPGQVS